MNFAAAREIMVDSQLKPVGVTNAAVLAAMGTVARERFVPNAAKGVAYADTAVEVAPGRYLLPPATLGQLLDRAELRAGDRVLVVGGATGYSAAICRHAGAEVTMLESDPGLVFIARALGIEVVEGPLADGHRDGAPYTLVLFEGAVEEIPDALRDQIAEGGRLSAVLVDRGVGRAIVETKAEGRLGGMSFAELTARPLPGFTRASAFVF